MYKYLVQISDTHLFADTEAMLLNLNTWQSYSAVLDAVRSHQKNQNIDMIIFTGDLSQDDSARAYQHIAHSCLSLHCPIYWLPGNHDDLAVMESVFSRSTLKPDKIIHVDSWTFILLNSHFSGQPYGMLSEAQLAWLALQLAESKDRHVLLFLHHPPVMVGSAWLDRSCLQNATQFFDVTDRFSHVRGIVCGHVHQAFETSRRDIPIVSAPSTCLQFLPRSQMFALDKVSPGYRWFKLFSEGTFSTGVERLPHFKNTVDFAATGY